MAIPNSAAVHAIISGLTANRRRLWRGLFLPVALIALWAVVSGFDLADHRLLASPGSVVRAGWNEVASGHVLEGLAWSLGRNLAGFIIGSVLGLGFGLLLGTSRLADRLVGPTFHAVKQIALFAWIPLLSVWFGVGEAAKVAFIALAVFYPVVVNTIEGIRGVRPELLEVARAYAYTRRQRLWRVILPAAAPQIFTGLHLALIYSWLATVGAEYFLKTAPGIGNLMIDGRERLLMDQVLFGVVVVGVVGLTYNRLATLLEARLLRWMPKNSRNTPL